MVFGRVSSPAALDVLSLSLSLSLPLCSHLTLRSPLWANLYAGLALFVATGRAGSADDDHASALAAMRSVRHLESWYVRVVEVVLVEWKCLIEPCFLSVCIGLDSCMD